MNNPDSPDYVIGIVGCGAMGQGIAQVSVQGGMQTLLMDVQPGAATAAKDQIGKRILRLAEKGRLTEQQAADAIDLLKPVDGYAGLAGADAVVEAAFEDLTVKREIFQELESVVGEDCILASNTSSIPLASIARACERRDRIAGLHFFNPVPLMKLVEVIRAAESSDQTIANLMALGRRMTRVPVEVKDSPGFLVNMGGRAYTTEALRIVHEGVATPAQVDAIIRDCWGFRMGPFELMDLTGIDVNYPVSQIIYEGYNQDPRLKTSPNHKAMFDAGLFGRKTGQGWYRYDEKGQKVDPPSADFQTDVAPATKVALSSGILDETDGVLTEMLSESIFQDETAENFLKDFCAEVGLAVIEDDGAVPLLAAPVGLDATTEANLTGGAHERLVCIDPLGDLSKRVTIMTAPGAQAHQRESVAAAIAATGRKTTIISDSPGFVGQRMVAMIANLGCYMAEIGLASPADIDTAMQLGLNYPQGSIALAEALGTETCFTVLSTLQQITGDDRYRPTLWLSRRAVLNLPIHTPN